MSNTYKDLSYSALMAKAGKAGFTAKRSQPRSYTRFEVIDFCPLACRASLVGSVGALLKAGALDESKNGGTLQGIQFIDIPFGRKGIESKSKLSDLLKRDIDEYLIDAVEGYEKWGIHSDWVDRQLRMGIIKPEKKITLYLKGLGESTITAPRIATTVCVAEYLYTKGGSEQGDVNEYLRSLPEGLASRLKPHSRDKYCDYCIGSRLHSNNVRMQDSADQLEELSELGIVPVVPVRW